MPARRTATAARPPPDEDDELGFGWCEGRWVGGVWGGEAVSPTERSLTNSPRSLIGMAFVFVQRAEPFRVKKRAAAVGMADSAR